VEHPKFHTYVHHNTFKTWDNLSYFSVWLYLEAESKESGINVLVMTMLFITRNKMRNFHLQQNYTKIVFLKMPRGIFGLLCGQKC
jgi:hypothetical protein